MSIIIKHLSLPGPAYYGGPNVGWTTVVGAAVAYASTPLAQAVIDRCAMYATVVTTPVVGVDVAAFAAGTSNLTVIAPIAISATLTGGSKTMALLGGPGPVMAVQEVGVLGGSSPTLDGKIQQAPDGSTWTDIAGGAFVQVAASSNLQVITFTPTQGFIRYVGTLGGGTPTAVVAVQAFRSAT